MRWQTLTLTLALLVLYGCATTRTRESASTDPRHPAVAAVYISPELSAAQAQVRAADGSVTEVAMGHFLRTELLRSAREAFVHVVVVEHPELPSQTRSSSTGAAGDDGTEAAWEAAAGPQAEDAEVLVCCYPASFSSEIQAADPGGELGDVLSFRAQIYFEVRDDGGDLLRSGLVEGRGTEHAVGDGNLPLTARLRTAMADAVASLSAQYSLALLGTPIDAPAPPVPALEDRERLAEAETDAEAM